MIGIFSSPFIQSYFIPMLIPIIHTILPLLLTLKALDIITQPNFSEHKTKKLLLFWLQYWATLYFLSFIGVHDWVKLFVLVAYVLNSNVLLLYALRTLHLGIVPQLTNLCNRFPKKKGESSEIQMITESDVNTWLEKVVEATCFNPNELWGILNFTTKSFQLEETLQTATNITDEAVLRDFYKDVVVKDNTNIIPVQPQSRKKILSPYNQALLKLLKKMQVTGRNDMKASKSF